MSDMTLFGYPARLVLTIDGRDVDVPRGLEYAPSGAAASVSNTAVLRMIESARGHGRCTQRCCYVPERCPFRSE